MAYVFLAIVVLVVVGLIARAVLAARRSTAAPDTTAGGSDVTDRSVRPSPPSGRPTRG